ncbi:Sds3-like-domain-containing protein [Lipomyces oligophaga]|uniref:Sds3-like-domain-containing protein n=1 Tax=Lipomyces oligophaga TaxID=45792 RepID=UPI0034CDC9A4
MAGHSPASTPSPQIAPTTLHSQSSGLGYHNGVTSSGAAGTGNSSNAVLPASKRDRRRHNMTERYNALQSLFASQKDSIYEETLTELQTGLAALHEGTDGLFLEKVADLEEERDAELVTLWLNYEFLLSRAEKEYRHDVDIAEEECESTARSIREALYNRLECQRKRLKEDKDLIDIANENSLLLSVDRGLYHHGGGSAGNDASSQTGVMGSVGERRLRRRGAAANSNGASASDLVVLAGALNADGKKRKRGGASGSGPGSGSGRAGEGDEIASFWSNREALPFGHTRENLAANNTSGSGRHRDKAFGGMTGLKSDEISEDLSILRKKKKIKRK